MILVVVIAVLALSAVVATLSALPKDGYRRTPTDATKLP